MTSEQDKSFAESLGSKDFLDAAIEWLQKNADPEDVFTDYQLEQWARRGSL